ncbi:serine/threonine protein kinase [Bifidobacterium ramosum]|uniref:serine/threonine protein kinase n=1 Tax=Bifidobacterium ramosum TaxID=1798158 RepID=UPI001EF9556C|nr:serine/threonine protein kinase [Bifidobacterium ramosum]
MTAEPVPVAESESQSEPETTVPEPQQTDEPSAGSVAQRKPPIAMMVTIVAAFIAVAVCVATFITYKMELWGPQTVPTVEASNAGDVAKQLADKGFIVKKQQQYSAIRKGGYIGMEGAKSGERIAKGSEVTVLESLGPGVPKGTVGSTAKQAETALKDMGVKVTEHEVVSENPGKVSVTMPADGQPVTDTDEGIHIGVGIEGDGVPVEIAGIDKDQAESELTGKGYTVTLEPRFSGRQYLGKIVGANPGIGVKTDATDVTLYYGVDASGRYDVLTGAKEHDMGDSKDIARTDRLAGSYCTEDGDCITMSTDESQKSDTTYYVSGEYNKVDSLNLCGVVQNANGCTPTNQADTEAVAQFSSLGNSLISGDTGAFELFKGLGTAYCGDDLAPLGPGYIYCDNGHLAKGDGMRQNSGETYKADDFFVYMPVDADLSAIESSGYFTNTSDYQPDKDRPYIIKRDNSDYKPAVIDSKATGPQYNPYIPNSNSKMVKFKEAPNKKNVYYLVETPIDWSLIDGTVASDGTADGDADGGVHSSGGSSDADSKSAAAWKELAGTYMFSSGAGAWDTTLWLKDDGTFTGYYHDDNLGDIGDDYPKGTRDEAKFSGRFESATKYDDGSYNLTCASDALAVEGAKGDERIENGMRFTTGDAYGMTPCGTFTVYPKGYAASKLSEKVRGQAFGGGYDSKFTSAPAIILVNDSTQEAFYQQRQ